MQATKSLSALRITLVQATSTYAKYPLLYQACRVLTTTRACPHGNAQGVFATADTLSSQKTLVQDSWERLEDNIFPISLPVKNNHQAIQWIPPEVKVTHHKEKNNNHEDDEDDAYSYEITVDLPHDTEPANLKVEVEPEGIWCHAWDTQTHEFSQRFTLPHDLDVPGLQAQITTHGKVKRLVLRAPQQSASSTMTMIQRRQGQRDAFTFLLAW